LTTENPANKFLDLERQAALVLEELEKLRHETSSYSAAAMGLETALNHLSSLSGRLKDLTDRSKDIIETLGTIGTPELLATSQAVQDEVKSLKMEIQNLREESNSNAATLSNEIKGIVTEIQSLREQTSSQLKNISDYQRRGILARLVGGKPQK